VKVLLALVVLGAGAWWVLRPRPTDRELIERLIAKAEHGVETKSLKEIMGCVASDYHDPAGLSKTDIWRIALQWVRSSEQVDVVIEDYALDLHPPTAIGRFDLRLIAEQGLLGIPATMQLTVEFAKERRRLSGVWLVRSVSGHGLEKEFEGVL